MTEEVTFTGVSKKFGSKFVIKDINLTIQKGELFCLVGPSGSGKSTLLKMLARIEEPTKGEVTASQHIAMVFQTGALLPWLTALENIELGLKVKGIRSAKGTAAHYLDLMKLNEFSDKYPRELSGGQRQRVGIARALAVEPEILLLDEPFSALDPFTTELLHKDLLEIWKQSGKTIVMVSHSLEEAILLADRVGVIKDGELKKIIDITLPRPRSIQGEAFERFVSELHSLFS